MKDLDQDISHEGESFIHDLGSRLNLAIVRNGQKQADFARAIGASPTFVSDVVRGQKKPGSEFLVAIKRAAKISIDWLLTGDGTISGQTPIDLEQMRSVRLRVSLAELACLENDRMAQGILDLIEQDRLSDIIDEPSIQSFLNSALDRPVPIDLILSLYNSQVWNEDKASAGKSVIQNALSYFKAKKPVDFSALLHQEKVESKNSQVNIGSGNRIAGRDYHEK